MSQSPRLDPTGKNRFLLLQILVLDLIGFSLIFPLVPHLLEYYLKHSATSPADFWVSGFIHWMEGILPPSTGKENLSIVLLGGILTSLYSFLQFLITPYWGRLSDRIGRRPVLLFTSTGLAVSYLLWFVSTSFTSFLISRILGGLMAGNLGVATASMADMSDAKSRTRSMGMVGAAFGVGFVVGPVVGGLSSGWNMTETFPGLSFLHPFSFCALISFLMASGAALRNLTSFQETLPPERRNSTAATASENESPLLARSLYSNTGFRRSVLINFLFLFTFSGFEFSFSFLLKIGYGMDPQTIGLIFLYSGVILILGQGYVVRKLTGVLREKSIILTGVALMPVPLVLLSPLAPSIPLALLAILPISLGASLVQPSLTGIASLAVASDRQGNAMGIFRSAGSLARALGPLAGSYVFWNMGEDTAYRTLGFMMAIIFFLAFFLKNPVTGKEP